MNLRRRLLVAALAFCGLLVAPAEVCFARLGGHHGATRRHSRKSSKDKQRSDDPIALEPAVVGTQLRLVGGSAFVVDEAWEDPQGIWYRKNGVTQLLDRSRVRTIERGQESRAPQSGDAVAEMKAVADTKVVKVSSIQPDAKSEPLWIYLVGGARVEADDATEGADGVWYRRGPLSVFIERARVDRVERETASVASSSDGSAKRGWSSGNARLDGLIKQSGTRNGVDPYLVFLVMEEESHFNSHVVSPKGARGLMQLMPGTGARFGVRHPFNAAESIEGGTRYLKQLLQRHNGRVDLALASYNAGEGAVAKFGARVPPYRETQNYVRRISRRYGRGRVAESGNHPGRREGGQ